ncbi:proton-translocating NADH-quinone oxidoreductase, chain L [Methanosalsum zhilinae DSM 4017]|uniref:Proton-translocating NADH-quinone oxidoreductase, chain L n=1 Tax=Methanosalsum zhilinae (strain DSM 4017 / NBRC 107636 / OCM 62 / WeN5) TaxID=679901 RepID=F7XPK4_METZD|nr:F420H2 dehydrogenase subunit FpoL [Methanosalsum zhilinae]AEH61430.1 proton-translocating NADH-quinone oxidoreductase, chain L [Methanosalsum zhilinae DSM 4017]
MNIGDIAFLIPLLPALAFVVTLFFGKKMYSGGALLPIGAIGASFVISLLITINLLQNPDQVIHQSVHWFAVFNLGILIDPLAAVMLTMVSLVSLLIHIYAIGYMEHDPSKPRYFAETSLFTAAMLGVVLSDNILQMFIFWELVGLCSYLLIGFWYQKPSAAAAAKKAFLTTRVGDIMFLAGIIILFASMFQAFHGEIPEGVYLLQFSEMFNNIDALSGMTATIFGMEVGHLTLIALLFFGGAIGKSGQFPLHVWLPDAMEGPTTVSALIHAATMVTAGVYLVARTFPMFLAAPDALLVVAYIGGFTALFAATMGLVMNDIKRVLAYSTVSQLGYMVLGLGMGAAVGLEAIGVSVFHLINHAFFKALLFLCAGSVIHAVGTQDMRQMGGLGKAMPITAITMLIASVSLAGFGIPGTSVGTSGFFSKDEIIETAFVFGQHTHDWIPYLFAILAALLTSIYIFRLFFMTFAGKARSKTKAHESPSIMTVPLMILAVFSLIFGALTMKPFIHFLERTFENNVVSLNIEHLASLGNYNLVQEHGHEPLLILWLPVIVAAAGLVISYLLYYRQVIDINKVVSRQNPVYKLLYNRYYQHRILTELLATRIVYETISLSADFFDRKFIDSIVDGTGKVTMSTGNVLRRIQTGVVQNYVTAVIAGVGLLIVLLKLIVEVL